MKYRGTINYDFTSPDPNESQRLMAALEEAGWRRVETSAYIIEADTLEPIWQGVELVAKQAGSIGALSAFTYHIQGSQDFNGTPYSGTLNKANALSDIKNKPFPC